MNTPKDGNQHSQPIENHSIERLAFTTAETAQALGIDRTSVWRLMKRGLLRPSTALRIPLFSRTEIERFLRDTQPKR
jgi:predicted DNA-binding transcriptional regulator AlpA